MACRPAHGPAGLLACPSALRPRTRGTHCPTTRVALGALRRTQLPRPFKTSGFSPKISSRSVAVVFHEVLEAIGHRVAAHCSPPADTRMSPAQLARAAAAALRPVGAICADCADQAGCWPGKSSSASLCTGCTKRPSRLLSTLLHLALACSYICRQSPRGPAAVGTPCADRAGCADCAGRRASSSASLGAWLLQPPIALCSATACCKCSGTPRCHPSRALR
mmetsp:Transcript_97105/g.273902  ORF Transcript_97105/g.273902 Transcript_97105/m.273902 type:complete len:221 (-) Transcript_97105:11-673(-)